MSEDTVKFIIAAILFLHGIAHIGPIGAYLWVRYRPQDPTGRWTAARAWLAPGLSARAATSIAVAFWALSLLGFVAAAFAFSGMLLPMTLWGPLAIISAIVSSVGIVAFFGTWPMFNTFAALAVDVAVLVTQLVLRWPAQAMFGGS